MNRPTPATQYLTEVVSYGGLPATRAEVIRDLRERCGATDKQIDYYLIGLDQMEAPQ